MQKKTKRIGTDGKPLDNPDEKTLQTATRVIVRNATSGRETEDLSWLTDDPPNFFTCPNDSAVLKLRGIFKYMHSEGVLATGEHWECRDCGYVCWRYLAPDDNPAPFDDDFPF